MTQKISTYVKRLVRLRKVDLVDVSEGGTVTKSITGDLLENVLAEDIGRDCQTGNEGIFSMTLVVDTGVDMIPTYITFKNTAGAMGSSDIVFKIGSTSGDFDILPPTQLLGFASDASWVYHIGGVLPEMLSASDTFFLELVTGSSGINIVDIRVHGNQFDV